MRFLYPWAFVGLLVVATGLWALRREARQRLGLDRAAFVLRTLALVALVLALTGPQSASREPLRYLYFVVDRSASAALGQDEASILQTLAQFEQAGDRTRYGMIVFGKQAYVDQPFSESLPRHIQTAVDPDGSDLAGALRLALDTLPLELQESGPGNAEILLLSDGQVDELGLLGVLEQARRSGVRIWTVALGQEAASDARVDSLQLPREVLPDQQFEGAVYVHAAEAGAGTLLVYRNEQLVQAMPVTLEPGANPLHFVDALPAPGHYRYQVRLQTTQDALLENNVATDMVTVSGSAAILVLEAELGQAEGLATLLGAAGFSLERKVFTPQSLRASDLAAFKTVILNNVPLQGLDAASVASLKAYVGELGGGLWVIEGQKALEGVSKTPMEEMLPVSFEGPQREQLPGVAITLVLDRSSSMGQAAIAGSGLTKLDVLKEAAAASIQVLREGDWIGIVIFDTSHSWLIPIQPLQGQASRQGIYDQIQQVFSGGGTDLLPALRDAFEQMENIPARIKHILVFSDGKTVRQDRDFSSLFGAIRESDVTMSSIGFGQQPDEEMLARIADAGQGQMYLVRDIAELPKISVRETRRIVQQRWVIGEFQPGGGPFTRLRLSGFDVDSLPVIRGYVRTYAKPLAQTAITVEGNPLLSFWQYGLGQVAVLNADMSGAWTANWVRWPQLADLVTEVISQLYSNPVSNAGLVVHSRLAGDTLQLELDALDGSRWVDLLEIQGSLIAESNLAAQDSGVPVTFTQVAPGRYEAQVPQVSQGLNLLSLEARSGEALATQQTHVVAVPYPSEYQHLGVNEPVLQRIALQTGATFLEDERWDLGPLGSGGLVHYRDLWPWGLGLSLFLFLLDLLLRKVPLEAWLSRKA